MANFSQDPAVVLSENRDKDYVGVHIEQGVPVLDRDLNLLSDLISSTVRSIFATYVGSGVANDSNAFLVVGEGNENDFLIEGPGACLVNGWQVVIRGPMLYSDQDDVDALTTPGAPGRNDIVYLDVWTSEVTGEDDTDLLNDGDVGMQTSVRRLLSWRVRVAEGGPVPSAEAGHAHYRLATMQRQSIANIEEAMVTDMRQTRLNLAAMEQRVRVLERRLFAPAFGETEFIPPAGGPGTEVRIFGINFDVGFEGGPSRVFFGNTEATVNEAQSTAEELRADVPNMPAGDVRIRVENDFDSATSQSTFLVQ